MNGSASSQRVQFRKQRKQVQIHQAQQVGHDIGQLRSHVVAMPSRNVGPAATGLRKLQASGGRIIDPAPMISMKVRRSMILS